MTPTCILLTSLFGKYAEYPMLNFTAETNLAVNRFSVIKNQIEFYLLNLGCDLVKVFF